MTVRKKMDFTKPFPRNFWCSSTAQKKLNTSSTGTSVSMLTIEETRSCGNFSSTRNARRKFSQPTKVVVTSFMPGVTVLKAKRMVLYRLLAKMNTKPIRKGMINR